MLKAPPKRLWTPGSPFPSALQSDPWEDIPRRGLVSAHDFWFPNVALDSEDLSTASWALTYLAVSGSSGNLQGLRTTSGGALDHVVQQVVTGVANETFTLECDVEAGDVDWVCLQIHNGVSYGIRCYFDLTNGAWGSEDNFNGGVVADKSFVDKGGGLYRLRIVLTAQLTNSTCTLRVYPADADMGKNYASTGNVNPQIYLGLMQAYPGSSNWPYALTTDLQFVPVLDADNLLMRSGEFDHARWNKTRSAVTANAVANPLDGAVTADKYYEDATAANSHQMGPNAFMGLYFFGSVYYTLSIYAKAAERSAFQLVLWNDVYGAIANTWFNLSTGEKTTSTGSAGIESLGDGWYRCWVSGVNGSTGHANAPTIFLNNPGGTSNYDGDGSSGLYLWGAQLRRANASPGTYAPTIERAALPPGWKQTQYALQRGATIAAEATDYTLLGKGARFASDYGLTGDIAEIALGGDWTAILLALFDGTTGTAWSLTTTASGHRVRIFYSLAGQLACESYGGIGASSGNLAVSTTDPCVIVLSSSSGALTMKRMDTGTSVTASSDSPSGTPRLAFGCLGETSPSALADALTGYHGMLYDYLLSAAEADRAYRRLKSMWASRGVTVL